MCRICQHGHPEKFSIPDTVLHELNQASPWRQEAHKLVAQGDISSAEARLREACRQPLRAVEYGRTLLDLARLVATTDEALAYLQRSEVLLVQDEHAIVAPEELELVKQLKDELLTPGRLGRLALTRAA